MMNHLRQRIPYEEFDYVTLTNCLKDYARPRDKITRLIRSKAIIRIKKGLYVFGQEFSRGPLSRELLANLIYGPSYISLEYALSYYGMIPESVETVTSVTSGKSRIFTTPIGRFTYWSIPAAAYRIGCDLAPLDNSRSFLIASREKALADFIRHDHSPALSKTNDFQSYLFEHHRMDPGELSRMNLKRLETIAQSCRSRRIHRMTNFLRTRFRSSSVPLKKEHPARE